MLKGWKQLFGYLTQKMHMTAYDIISMTIKNRKKKKAKPTFKPLLHLGQTLKQVT